LVFSSTTDYPPQADNPCFKGNYAAFFMSLYIENRFLEYYGKEIPMWGYIKDLSKLESFLSDLKTSAIKNVRVK